DFNGALGRFQSAVEFDQKSIPYRFNLGAVEARKDFAQQLSMFLQQFLRKLVVALRERAVAHHVCEHDGREFALLAVFGRHERIKPDRARNEMANTPTLYPLSPIVTQSPDSFGHRGFINGADWA